MNEADYLRLPTHQAEQANDFLYNARKWERERWVCQRFLEALNVPYRLEDFTARVIGSEVIRLDDPLVNEPPPD